MPRLGAVRLPHLLSMRRRVGSMVRRASTRRRLGVLAGGAFAIAVVTAAAVGVSKIDSGTMSSAGGGRTNAVAPVRTGGKQGIIVTRDDRTLPRGCSPREVATFLTGFFDDFNQGRIGALRRRFAAAHPHNDSLHYDPPANGRFPFRWYSVTRGRAFAAYDRATLLRYFRSRRTRNEQLALLVVDVGAAGRGRAVAFSYVLRRAAADISLRADEQPYAWGGGGMNCSPNSIYVWNMAGPPSRSPEGLCPLPDAWIPGEPVVACTQTRGRSS